MSHLCVSITSSDLASIRSDVQQAVFAGADMVEMRLDYMPQVPLDELPSLCTVPVIWTLRHASEGGKWQGASQQRLAILEPLCRNCSREQFIDLEYRIWRSDPDLREGIGNVLDELRSAGKSVKLILSFHDFQAMPARLPQLAAEMARDERADVIKLAGFANHICDNFAVFDLLHGAAKPTIALAMGPAGQISRVLAGKLGGFLTFASLGSAKASAPGQVTVYELVEMYRFSKLEPGTRVYGVIADPVAHSMSPAIHNAAFAEVGFDGVYLPMLVQGGYDQFEQFLDGLLQRPWLTFGGVSVTIPHKGNALRFLQCKSAKVDPLAARIGAVNTIVVEAGGQPAGYNTDYQAVLDSLSQAASLDGQALAGVPVAVLGAGGVSRSIVAALVRSGAEVTIYNRTEAKARALADEFGCKWRPWSQRDGLTARVVINGTSIGMWPKDRDCPLPASTLTPEMVVFDTVYNPVQTKLLEHARRRGCTCIDGLTMFVAQAAAQFRLWTQMPAPKDRMRQVVLQALAKRA